MEENSNKEIIATHNKSRATYEAGDKRKDFEVGDFVRILAPDKVRRGIGYKVYHGLTYEKKVRKIIGKTKKANPVKYRLDNKKYYTQDRLIKASQVDQKSEELIKKRDKENRAKDEEKREYDREFQKAVDVVKEEEIKTGSGKMVTRKTEKFLNKLKQQRKKDKEELELIEEKEEVSKKERKKPVGKKERNVTRKNAKDVSKFKELVKFIKGEQSKDYSNKPNEADLIAKYNKSIQRGKDIAKALRKDKVRLTGISINYFKQFDL